MKGQKGGGEGREGEGCPVEDRWTSKSNCAASGRAEGESDLLVHKLSSEPRILLSPGGPGAGTAPRGGHRESPPSLYSSQSEPACGTPLSPPPAGAFQEWLRPQPPERQRVAAGWPPRRESFPWVGYVAALPACGRCLRRQFTGGVGSLLICTLWFLPFSQTLSNDFCCCLLPRFKTIWSDTDMRAYT